MTADHAPDSHSNDSTLTVWDLPLRVFHWTLVAAVIGAFVTNALGVSYFKYHVWCGYTVIVAVSFRILWGFVGTYHARFRNFVRGPRETLEYGADLARGHHRSFAGHNPLGALMVLALLALLGVQAGVGLFGNDEIFNVGPLYGYVSDPISLVLTSIHRRLFWAIAVAAGLHLAAILAHRVLFQENLVIAMLTGRKSAAVVREAPTVKASHIGVAIAINVVLVLILALIVLNAPIPVSDISSL